MNVDFLKENGIDVDKSLDLFGDIETYNDTIGEFILGASFKLPKLEEYKNAKDMNNKDGKEALEIIASNRGNNNIKAILLDLNMPQVDGFAVLNYMKENNLLQEMPVSIISGDSTKETIDKAFTYPIVDMIKKPFNDTEIKRVVEKTIFFKEMQ